MDLDIEYRLCDKSGREMESASGRIRAGQEDLSIYPADGNPLILPWREISGIKAEDYKVVLETISGDLVRVSSLGYKFEDFLRVSTHFRNEMMLKDMLMSEPLKKSQIEAEYALDSTSGKTMAQGKCELRLYETALIVMPDTAAVRRFPFREISNVKNENHAVTVSLDSGEKITFSKLGNKFDFFTENLGAGISGMLAFGQRILRDLTPAADALTIRKASSVVKEGKILPIRLLRDLCPGFREGFEKKIKGIPESAKEYEFLRSLGNEDKICAGFKKGLMGALSGDYFMYLVPFCRPGDGPQGNAVAMETVPVVPRRDADKKTSARATYFFRMCPNDMFSALKTVPALDAKMDEFIALFNRCMSAVNFRRAPIFATEAMLQQPKYAAYRQAAATIAELKTLRSLFIGRVMHSDHAGWTAGIKNILKFNAASRGGAEKWPQDAGLGEENDEPDHELSPPAAENPKEK